MTSARGRSIGGETQTTLVRIAALELGDLRLPSPVASVVEDKVNRAGQISGETLRRFSITFDYSHNIVYLRSNRFFSKPFNIEMAGWFLIAGGPALDRREVFLALDGSPAAVAGVKEGDRIVSVDGRAAESLTLEEILDLFKQPGRTHVVRLSRGGAALDATIRTRRLL